MHPQLRVVQRYVREVRALGFSETPDYEHFSGILRDLNQAQRDFVDSVTSRARLLATAAEVSRLTEEATG